MLSRATLSRNLVILPPPRVKPRVALVICAARVNSAVAISKYSGDVFAEDVRARYRRSDTACNGLLISWAMVAATLPTTASFSLLINAASVFFRTVMSRRMTVHSFLPLAVTCEIVASKGNSSPFARSPVNVHGEYMEREDTPVLAKCRIWLQ